jgi:hydroxyacyl-ACP dehydratase HTD2-like protein with hotdog domain
MLTVPGGMIGRDVDLGSVEVTADRLHQYAAAVGDDILSRAPLRVAPLGFLFALRGGPLPAVELAADTVSVHGGHTITSHRALTAPGVYHLQARIADAFEKNGRSGPLTVIARRAEIRAADGSLVATVDDQQIVRWRRVEPTAPLPAISARRANAPRADEALHTAASTARAAVGSDLEVAALVAVQRRLAPAASAIATYARSLAGGEPVFTDRAFARALGYADVIVPGPLQSALLEAFLRERLPGWTLHRLSLTFRVSLIAREPISLAAVAVEHSAQRRDALLVCDLSLENGNGERAALGLAELTRKS